MDIGYTMLFNYIEAILNIYGFDIYKGNLHKEFYKRISLVCDMIEPFRPIVDYKIRICINLRQLDNYKYTVDNGQYHIDWKDGANFMLLILDLVLIYYIYHASNFTHLNCIICALIENIVNIAIIRNLNH